MPINPPRNESSTIGQVWAACDKIAGPNCEREVTRPAILAACGDLDKGTVSTQYQRWRTYNGLAKVRGANPSPKKKVAPKKKAVAKKAAKKKVAKKAAKKRTRKPAATAE